MNELGIEINDLIEIKILDGQSEPTYRSRVEGIGSAEIIVAWPTGSTGLIDVMPRLAVRTFFLRGQSVLGFDGVIQEVRSTPIPVLVIRPLGTATPCERRHDFRVRTPVELVLTEKVISLAGYRDLRELITIKTSTITLSAGGFSISHNATLQPGTLFDVSMSFPERSETLEMVARVVRCIPHAGAHTRRFEIGFAFLHIPESARARIVRFVFRAQLAELDSNS